MCRWFAGQRLDEADKRNGHEWGSRGVVRCLHKSDGGRGVLAALNAPAWNRAFADVVPACISSRVRRGTPPRKAGDKHYSCRYQLVPLCGPKSVQNERGRGVAMWQRRISRANRPGLRTRVRRTFVRLRHVRKARENKASVCLIRQRWKESTVRATAHC